MSASKFFEWYGSFVDKSNEFMARSEAETPSSEHLLETAFKSMKSWIVLDEIHIVPGRPAKVPSHPNEKENGTLP